MNLLTCPTKEKHKTNGGTTTLSRFRNEMERAFDRFFVEPLDAVWHGRNGADWMPKLDMIEDHDGISLRMELPGVTPRNVDVSVRDNILTISGHKESSSHEEGKDFYVSEREFGSFRRSLELPPGCDAEKIAASQENGVLTVKIPRSRESTSKRIAVKAGSGS